EATRQISCADLLHEGDRHRGVGKRTVDRVSEASESGGIGPRRNPVDRCDSRLGLRLHERDRGPEVENVRSDDLFHRDSIVRARAEIPHWLAISYHDSILLQVVSGRSEE